MGVIIVSDRAKQFMPFAALNGFYDLIRERERVIVPKHELTEDKAEELSDTIKSVEKGDMIKVIFYSDGEYVSAEGIVTKIDIPSRRLTVVKTEIDLDDIWDIVI